MLQLACKDLGMNCPNVVSGTTVDEVKKKAMSHAQIVHADALSKMTPKQMADMDKVMESKIRS